MSRRLLSAPLFEKLRDCARFMGAVAGGNERGLPGSGSLMALPGWRSYTGMKLMELDAKSSRSSSTSTDTL